MLEYEWGTQSNMIISGAGAGDDQDHHHHPPQFYDHYSQAFTNSSPHNHHQLVNSAGFTHNPTHHHYNNNFPNPDPVHFALTYDPRAPFGASSSSSPYQLPLEPDPTGYMLVPKPEPVVDFASRIGLNLGGRTYFSSAESEFVNRLYRRSRQVEAGSVNAPRCQAEGCNADLTHAKHYHRRHKVCEFHSKAAAVVAAGLTQRFCQQCSRFHLLTEFDNGKRSCRKRLADHNRRRRKSNNNQLAAISNQEQQNTPKSQTENASAASPSDNNLPRSSPESGAQSSSSVTLAVSPPRISLDCFRQRSYQAAAAAATSLSPSPSSLFFSNG